MNDQKPLTAEQQIAASFAKVELLELLAGRRTLGQCPGLKAMGRHIEQHEARAKKRPQTSRRKVHFIAMHDEARALCGAQTIPAMITDKPADVTCLFCRRFNLKVRAEGRADTSKL
jgi:hypothetical protein